MKERITEITKGGKIIGIGTGKTIEEYISVLNPESTYVPSSIQTMILLKNEKLSMSDPSLHHIIDLYIDGADYFDKKGNLIKGKGGALTTEKMLCSIADDVIVLVQDYKFRENFNNCLVPIEIVPVCLSFFLAELEKRNLKYFLRSNKGKIGPVMSDLGNFIVDVEYNLEFLKECKNITGVIEHGYFDAEGFDIAIQVFKPKNTNKSQNSL